MRNKRLLAALLATVMVAGSALTGCGASSSQAAGGESAGGGEKSANAGGKFTIFQSKTEIMDQLNQLAKDYKNETGVEIEVWETSGDNYYKDLKTGISTESGPVLFSLAPGSESVEMSDYLEDVSDLSFMSKISDNLKDSVDGKVVGVPYTIEGFGLVYDGNLVDTSKIGSTDALIDYLKEAKGKGINGLGLSQEDYFLIAHILNTPFAVQDDPDAYLQQVLKGEVRMKDNDAFKEFAKLMEAIRENCTNPVDVTYDNNCGDFATGKAAMIHQGNWAYGMFKDYDVDFDMGIAPVPINGNKKVAVSVPAAWYINVDASDEEKSMAKDFLEWLYTSDKGKDYLMNQFGFVPVVDGMTSDKLDPLSKSISEASKDSIPWVMSNWPAGIITTSLSPITQEFFTNPSMTGEELIDKLNDAFVNAK
ncbi:raffinose/stachyose/melibiose transport system substrate-binding protein [Butyrivibrio hungatei]|uniref:Raffinose/stachyose/melibiose transport system substrate-binding protein n=1 Tax=Butyrivibrio hungatei TaxID=185008 RepID=A0A1G5CVR2_9FIRM|nr:extracellular solute-binding protein [Butyrivibrio hungatei]SCY06397.1 raffinose/stachyose/melibiose transport system substrate-binding protein [Butyrivibrio hungatei]